MDCQLCHARDRISQLDVMLSAAKAALEKAKDAK